MVQLRNHLSEVMADIESLSRTPRPAGSHANDRVEQVIRSRLESLEKFAVRVQTFEFKRYLPKKYLFQVDGKPQTCLPLLCSKSTPRTGITASLAKCTFQGLHGKIALVPIGKVHESLGVEGAAAKGAVAAIIFQTSGPMISARAAYPLSSIPCLSVPGKLGRNLWNTLPGRKVEARVVVQAEIARGRARNIFARPRSAPPNLLLVAHRDSRIFSPGAIDNASGCALLLLSARLSAKPNHEILFTDAEEYGLQGAKHFLNSERLDRATEVVNFDSVGAGRLSLVSRSRSGRMSRTLISKLRRIANTVNVKLGSVSTPRGSDSDVFHEQGFHACWVRGYPSPTATTVDDTIEYVDSAIVGKSIRLLKALIE